MWKETSYLELLLLLAVILLLATLVYNGHLTTQHNRHLQKQSSHIPIVRTKEVVILEHYTYLQSEFIPNAFGVKNNYTLSPISQFLFSKSKVWKSNPFIMDPYFLILVQYSVLEAAKKYGIDVELVYAIIHKESCFYPYDISSKDCYGLMQINYPIWKDVLGLSSEIELFDIHKNIMCGTRILNIYIKKNNSLVNALQAYFGYSKYSYTYAKNVLALYKMYKKINNR